LIFIDSGVPQTTTDKPLKALFKVSVDKQEIASSSGLALVRRYKTGGIAG